MPEAEIKSRQSALKKQEGEAIDATRVAQTRAASLDEREEALKQRDSALALKEKLAETMRRDLSARLAQLRTIAGA